MTPEDLRKQMELGAELPEDLQKEVFECAVQKQISLEWLVKLYRRGYNEKLGATGARPFGKLNKADEGELRVAIGLDTKNSVVRLEFGKPVSWLAVPAAHARHLAQILLEKADELDRTRS